MLLIVTKYVHLPVAVILGRFFLRTPFASLLKRSVNFIFSTMGQRGRKSQPARPSAL